MSPTTHCYFNFPEAKNLIKANYQSVISLEEVFGFEPVPTELSSDKAKYILGGQANVWTELLITPEQIEEKILPRMCALSEVLWTEKEKRTGFSDFLSRLNHVYPRLAAMNYNCFIQPLKSPNGKIVFLLKQNNNRLSYNVTMEDSVVIEDSPLGLERNDISFSEDLLFIGIENSEINDSYDLKTGKQLHNIANGKQSNFVFKNKKNGEIMILQARAYNEGIAFRYVFPGKSDKTYSILEEKTGFKIPVAGRTWIMPYDTVSMYTPSYETFYTNGAAIGTVSPNKEGWSFPALFQVKNKWVLITESGLTENYCASHLQPNPIEGLYQIRFPEKTEALGLFSEFPTYTLPWIMPWRVIVVGNTCGEILESSLVTHLAEPSKIKDADWIKPGKASWSWWSDHDSPRNFEALKKFVDLSAGMGWEYSLVDANWDIMKGGDVGELINYAQKRNVAIWLWYNSGGKINNVTERPRDIMFDSAKRKAEFAKLQSWGVKGVKIDFFQSDKQAVIKLYTDILRDAAENHIMVNFHGCTLPRGWQRTYPNLLSMEAVRGAENYGYDVNYPQKAVWHNTIYPFTRNVVGSMDYTPVTLSNQKFPHLTSNAHELALAIVFESGILHFADKIDSYTGLDYSCKQLLKNLPTTWDETRFIAGEPGKYVILARRKGTDWFVAGINGQETDQKVELDTDKMPFTRIITDGAGKQKLQLEKISNTTGLLKITMKKSSGFIGF
jgi:hypothetical protein